MINTILCGGYGSRLWPLSRKFLPKQFYPFGGKESLFQDTVQRNRKLCSQTQVILGEDHYYMAKEQLQQIGIENGAYIVEPVGRNTAPAIALACLAVSPDEVMLVTPSDHRIGKADAYQAALERSVELAEAGNLVTFGIQPAHPDTGFGYIEASSEDKGEDVLSFKEKPDEATAKSYIEQGNYYWNSGMFCFKAGVFLDELKAFRPDIYEASVKAFEVMGSDGALPMDAMMAIPKESIDYAVMERSSKVKVVPCEIGWADLGSIDSLYEELPKDDQKNMISGQAQVINRGSTENLIFSDRKVVALIDIDGLNIVDTDDALLITKRGSSQQVKQIVETLDAQKSELTVVHTTVARPWGSYSVLEEKPGFKVKRIEVKPGARLSLQRHQKRSEHWTVAQGEARIVVNEDTLVRKTGEFVVIPAGAVHRLENIGQKKLIIVEVQMGDYLGEDDIERLEDDYIR